MPSTASRRPLVLRIIFIGMALVLVSRLFALQLLEDDYKVMSNDITIYRKVVYPTRGVVYDRKGRVLVHNDAAYDLTMISDQVPKRTDSVQLCRLLGIDLKQYRDNYEKAKWMNGPKREGTFLPLLSPAQTARMQENIAAFPGFFLQQRSIRSYPEPVAGVVLGYTGEVSPGMLEKDRFKSYRPGDYVGLDGLELKYEEVLRGERGIHFFQKDNFNRPKDRYKAGKLDTNEIAGRSLELYLDRELQAYGEKLMAGKLGSIVAIEPSTGGILAMVSAPSYDPNLLRGADRSRNFSKLYSLSTKPLFNRAMKASYPPGSTQKPMTALIALDEGAITPAYGYPCGGGYSACGKFIACTHSGGGHAANLRLALANSCNSYFVNLYRLSADLKKWGGAHAGLQKWFEYMYSFGFGHPTGVDLPFEIRGTVFDSTSYNKMYSGHWSSCTNLFIGMGQGELTVTPLQMANAMAIIANHGYYYLPHLVKSINKNPKDTVLAPYLEKHVVTHIPDTMFTTVGLGMMDVVDKGTGKVAQLPGVEVCAKTGTVENKAAIGGVAVKLQNHSMFVAFAPRVNPKIAIAVAVENAGYGATWAGPVASLMIEKYLNDSISVKRKALEERMFKGVTINKYVYILDSLDRQRARERDVIRKQQLAVQMADKRSRDSLFTRWYIDGVVLPWAKGKK